MSPDDLARNLERAVNDYRRGRGLRVLDAHPVLAAACRQHSERMPNLGFFDHRDPYDLTSALGRVEAIDCRLWTVIAENLAAGQWTADQILEGWLDSPGHRANLERPNLTHIGTAVVLGGPLCTYITQIYATESSAPLFPSPVRIIAHGVPPEVLRQIRALLNQENG